MSKEEAVEMMRGIAVLNLVAEYYANLGHRRKFDALKTKFDELEPYCVCLCPCADFQKLLVFDSSS